MDKIDIKMKPISQTRLENLEILIDEAGSVTALAERCGYAKPNYIYQIRNQSAVQNGKPKNIGNAMARRLEEGMGKPEGWMDRPAKDNEFIERGQGHMQLWSKNDPLPEDEFVQVPFYKEVAFKAGNGCCEMEDYNGYTLGFSKATLYRSGVSSKDVVCVSVSGNSMEPVLPEGTTIGIDLTKTAITDGKIYAIKHDDLFRVKLLYRLPGQKLKLKSYNDAEYPEEIVDASDVSVMGLVFWWSVLAIG